MTGVTVLGKDGTDIPVKIDRAGFSVGSGRSLKKGDAKTGRRRPGKAVDKEEANRAKTVSCYVQVKQKFKRLEP